MKRKQQTVTQEQLHHFYLYDPETGIFIRRVAGHRVGHRVGRWNVGERAGTVNANGYRQIMINRKPHLEHHLAWLYMTGEWAEMIDHQNRDKADNRFTNLRLTTKSLNGANSKQRSHSRNPYKGVRRAPDSDKWVARISVDGKTRHLGCFATAEEAHAAYVKAARESFGVYASAG